MAESITPVQYLEFSLFVLIHVGAAVCFGYIFFQFAKRQFQTRDEIWISMLKRLLVMFLLEKIPSYFPLLSKIIFPSSIWASRESGIGFFIGFLLLAPAYYLFIFSTIVVAIGKAVSLRMYLLETAKTDSRDSSA